VWALGWRTRQFLPSGTRASMGFPPQRYRLDQLAILADATQRWDELARTIFRFTVPEAYEFGVIPPPRSFLKAPRANRLGLRIREAPSELSRDARQTRLWQILQSPHHPLGCTQVWMYLGPDLNHNLHIQVRGVKMLRAGKVYPIVTNWTHPNTIARRIVGGDSRRWNRLGPPHRP
jgi:hypothetical protein